MNEQGHSQSLIDLFDNTALYADPRKRRGKRHSLQEILLILLVGYMLKIPSYRAIWRAFTINEDHRAALEKVLPLPYGIPHYSTFSRVLSTLDPIVLAWSVADFFYQLLSHGPDKRQHICVDGKAIRAAQSKSKTGRNLYILNVFDAGVNLFLLQLRVDEKKQEAKEFERQAESILDGMWGTVTADALSSRKTIVEKILDCGMDAVLPIKGNNDNLKKRILTFFHDMIASESESASEHIDAWVDLNGHEANQVPAEVVTNPVISFHEEDNPTNGDDVIYPLEKLRLYDKLFNYPKCEYGADGTLISPVCDPSNKHILWVAVDGRWISLVQSHDRYERREIMLWTDLDGFAEERCRCEYEGWDGIKTVGLITRYRAEFFHDSSSPNKPRVLKLSITRTPYITTCLFASAMEFGTIVRRHWAIETAHGVIDKFFSEDKCSTRTGAGPENCSCLRKTAYNIVSLLFQRSGKKGPADNEEFTACAEKHCSTVRKALDTIKELVIPG